jgi:hypothetical protein
MLSGTQPGAVGPVALDVPVAAAGNFHDLDVSLSTLLAFCGTVIAAGVSEETQLLLITAIVNLGESLERLQRTCFCQPSTCC